MILDLIRGQTHSPFYKQSQGFMFAHNLFNMTCVCVCVCASGTKEFNLFLLTQHKWNQRNAVKTMVLSQAKLKFSVVFLEGDQ